MSRPLNSYPRNRSRLAGLVFVSLRAASAFGGILNGFALTFVFSRVLEPSAFALFMWVGNLGIALWVCELGLTKVLYLRLREAFFAETLISDRPLRNQAASVVACYGIIVTVGVIAVLPLGRTSGYYVSLPVFFIVCALNLPWNAVRNIAAATDSFVAFELLEAVRRFAHIGLIAAIPLGLPMIAALLLGVGTWMALLVGAGFILVRADGMAFAMPAELLLGFGRFIAGNRRNLSKSGVFGASELYSYNYPLILVPIVYGLGASAIAFDTAYKVFRGANLLLAAACEVVVPWQTSAFKKDDRQSLIQYTAIAALLSAAPAAGICALLLFSGDRLFTLLLGGAAKVPWHLTVLVSLLILANWLQTIANFLLVHTGFLSELATTGVAVAVTLSLSGIYLILFQPSIVGFTASYAAIYGAGAVVYFVLALRLPLGFTNASPIRTAAKARRT